MSQLYKCDGSFEKKKTFYTLSNNIGNLFYNATITKTI
jgi:hypothetical protein